MFPCTGGINAENDPAGYERFNARNEVAEVWSKEDFSAGLTDAEARAQGAAVIDGVNTEAQAQAQIADLIGSLPGNTFLLTTGQDNLVGTSGNDTFKAYIFDKWINNNSRADLVIEDIRLDSINSNRESGVAAVTQITKDVTLTMRNTDAGAVDYRVYFEANSLKAAPTIREDAQLNIELMDTRSAVSTDPEINSKPLLENPFNGFTFKLDGKSITVQSEAIGAAVTYPELLIAVQNAVAAIPALRDFTVAISGKFTATDTLTGIQAQGDVITITGGDDVVVLGTNDTEGLAGGTSVGSNDTVADFAATANNREITLVQFADLGNTATTAGITFESLTAAQFQVAVNAETNAALTPATKNVFLVQDGDENVFKVFTTESAANSADFTTVKLVGTVDLADTDVNSLTFDNFA